MKDHPTNNIQCPIKDIVLSSQGYKLLNLISKVLNIVPKMKDIHDTLKYMEIRFEASAS
jgi:hypothetical protein